MIGGGRRVVARSRDGKDHVIELLSVDVPLAQMVLLQEALGPAEVGAVVGAHEVVQLQVVVVVAAGNRAPAPRIEAEARKVWDAFWWWGSLSGGG